jgi:tRNA(Ile)-lysidine synthase
VPADAAALVAQVAQRLRELVDEGPTCLVAVSGGPDSMALLDLLVAGRELHGRAVIAGHVDHGLDPASGDVAAGVVAAARERGVPSRLVRLELEPGTSETRSRVARRAALERLADDSGACCIVLAHHADDQAETILLRLLRGSGPAGLSGMMPRTGRWVRPLLDIRRADLTRYLAHRGIEGWNDPANADPRHLRSWLRTAVIPGLVARLPDTIDRINRSGAQAALARQAWDEVPRHLPELDLRIVESGISVAASVVANYRSSLRHAILAAIGRELGVLLGARRLAAVDRLLQSHSGGSMSLAVDVRAELAFGRLALYRLGVEDFGPVDLVPGEVAIAGQARFTVLATGADAPTREGWIASLVPGRYRVRPWRAGDRIRPLGGHGSRAVSVVMREARVPRSQRKIWPLVVRGDDATVVWVPGICRSDVAVPAEGADAWRVECAVT